MPSNFSYLGLDLIARKVSTLMAGIKGINYAIVMESKLTAMLIMNQVKVGKCVGIYQSRIEANTGIRKNPAQLLLLSTRIKGGSHFQVLDDILKYQSKVRTLVFVADDDIGGDFSQFNGVVAEKDLGDLSHPGINALQAAIACTKYRSKSILESQRTSTDQINHLELTARELQIIHRMDRGMNNTEIASELGVKPETLKKYCTIIYSKLGTSNKHLAIKFALDKNAS